MTTSITIHLEWWYLPVACFIVAILGAIYIDHTRYHSSNVPDIGLGEFFWFCAWVIGGLCLTLGHFL